MTACVSSTPSDAHCLRVALRKAAAPPQLVSCPNHSSVGATPPVKSLSPSYTNTRSSDSIATKSLRSSSSPASEIRSPRSAACTPGECGLNFARDACSTAALRSIQRG
eukprot:scaffold3865_cov61-Phaeocystis_antarctica.AAC.4